MKYIIAITAAVILAAPSLYAAVGCDLNDPDRDVKRLFPGATGYKTIYASIDKKGGASLLAKIEERLGDKFTGLFETADVPYTIYEIYSGKARVGYIHGVNQKGKYGGIQVFLSLDTSGVIKNFYYQRLTSKEGKLLRSGTFAAQFIGLSLKEFYRYDVSTGTGGPAIKNPAPAAEQDFRATLRATKKNLILMDEFIFGNKYLQFMKQ
jgi:hypothetical protein